MPDPARLLMTLQRALDAVLLTPGRVGHLIELNDAHDVMVAGDLHGNLTILKQLLDIADLARHPRRHLVLQEVIHGPQRYPQGGDRSHQALDVLAALKVQFPRQFHLLPGNHEIAQLTNRQIGKDTTDNLLDLFIDGLREAYRDQSETIYTAYLALFRVLPLALRTANRVFISHSLPSAIRLTTFQFDILKHDDIPESEYQPGGSVYSLVWGRDVSPMTVQGFLERVDADWLISGHLPCENGFQIPNDRQIVLECQRAPGGYVLFRADVPVTFEDLTNSVHLL